MIYALSLHPETQDKLRSEIVASEAGDHPTVEALNSLQYMDAVIHETMRLHSPVIGTIREAAKDDVIPTQHEWVDKNGISQSGIR